MTTNQNSERSANIKYFLSLIYFCGKFHFFAFRKDYEKWLDSSQELLNLKNLIEDSKNYDTYYDTSAKLLSLLEISEEKFSWLCLYGTHWSKFSNRFNVDCQEEVYLSLNKIFVDQGTIC